MMKYVHLALALLFVSSCSPLYQTDYEIVPPKTETGSLCANNCLLVQSSCRQQCQTQQSQCSEIVWLRGQRDYLIYVNQQNANSRPVKKSEQDFYRMDACSNQTCEASCIADYRICHTNCGGKIIPHTYCVAHCGN